MLSQAEKQDILEAAVMAIVTQGGPSYDPVQCCCAYRGPNGVRCIVGHFIDDQNYDASKLEGRSVAESIVQRALAASLGVRQREIAQDLDFFTALQRAHDRWSFSHNPENYDDGLVDYFDFFSQQIQSLCFRFDLRFPEELL